MVLLIIIFLSLSIGLYLLMCSAARLPTVGTTLAAMRIVHPKEKKGNVIHIIVSRLSTALSSRIRLSEDRKEELQLKLYMAGNSTTPEYHVAKIIVNFLLWLAAAVFLATLNPLLGAITAGYGIYMLTRDISSLDRASKGRRDKIDGEMPRLAATLAQELQSNRDIIGILTAFQPSTTSELRDELEITLADMRSGSPEKALWRMNRRVGSIMLNEIIHGLQMVLQGSDAVSYFQTLQSDFKRIEMQKLALVGKKRPGRIQVHTFILLICFMVTVFVALLLYAYTKAKGLI